MGCLLFNIPGALFLTSTGNVTLPQLTIVYGITAALSFILLIGCFLVNKKQDQWLAFLFCSVFVVNIGYLLLSASQNLSQALNANRLAYLGSVFLPLALLISILRVTRTNYPRWLPKVLFAVGALVFCIAASPGILTIYYKEVSFLRAEGNVVLDKVYGPLHPVYLVYLLGYFAAMVALILRSVFIKKIESISYAVMLACAVFINIAVWMVEQFLSNRFEFLSVSYIITELFLLGLHLIQSETEKKVAPAAATSAPAPEISPEQLALFSQGLSLLTPKEQEIYNCYLEGMTTEQILSTLSITENTLKFHNKNLYGKLGVKSRRQLKEIHRQLQ